MQSAKKTDAVIDRSILFFIFFLPFLAPASYVALLVALALWLRKQSLRRILDFQPRIFGWALLGFIFVVGLSVIFSVDRILSAKIFGLFIFYPLSCLLIADNARNEHRAEKILRAVILSGLVITVFGMVQYLARIDFDYKITFLPISLRAKEGIGSTLGNPNRFAKYLDLLIPLSLVTLLAQKGLRRRILPGILVILGLVCLVLSRSLGGMAAVFAVLMLILLIRNWKVCLVVMTGLFVFTSLNYGWFIKTITKYGTPGRRFYTWAEVVPSIFKSYPLVGSGLGTYELVSWRQSLGKEWVVDITNPYEGSRCMQATVSWSWLWQDVSVEPERYYTVSAYMRSDVVSSEKTRDPNTFLTLECLDDKNKVVAREWGVVNAGSSWGLEQTQIVTPPGTHKMRIKLAKRQGEGSIWFDDVALTESSYHISKDKGEKTTPEVNVTIPNPGFELLKESGRPQTWMETPGRSTVSTAHSLYLNYLCELGIVGLGWLLLIIAIFFHSSITYLRKHASMAAGGVIAGCALSVLAALIHGTVETFLDAFQLGLMFWIIVGLAMGILRFHSPRQEEA